jgi:hypothetical protein
VHVDAVDDDDEESEQPDDSEDPEKDTLRMCRSFGFGVLRRWLKLWPMVPRTCIVTGCAVV